VLTAITFDEKIEWYEAAILILMYIAYFLIMWANGHLVKLAKKLEVKLIGTKTVLNDPGKLMFLIIYNKCPLKGLYFIIP
jgi:hypothetical protein